MEDFLDWVRDHAWVAWGGIALVFGIVETTTVDLVFLMLAGGAVAGGATALLGGPFLLQAAVAIATSLALLGFVRPVAKRHLRVPGRLRTGAAALVGRQAVVIEEVTPTGGTVKLGGEVWTARSFDGQSVLAMGSTVDVVEIQGATAMVFGLSEPPSSQELGPESQPE